MKNYPLIDEFRRRPNKKFDGSKNYGKPCVICGTGTIGEMWGQVSFMRGDDETVRVCAEHWKTDHETIIEKWLALEVNDE